LKTQHEEKLNQILKEKEEKEETLEKVIKEKNEKEKFEQESKLKEIKLNSQREINEKMVITKFLRLIVRC